jgi:ribonuclease HI
MIATSTLSQYMNENSIDIALIQEPYCIQNKVSLFPLKHQIIQSSNRPKAAIILNPIKVCIKAMILEKHTNDHIVWAIIKYKNENYYFCSYYFPPSLPITTFITKLIEDIKQIKPKNLILSGDANAKSKLWYNHENNKRGDEVIEFVLEQNLLILNNSCVPTFLSPSGQSMIDLTITNANTFDIIENWKVLDIESNSDHSYITFDLNVNTNHSFAPIILNINTTDIPEIVVKQLDKKYITKKFNWDLFDLNLTQTLNNIYCDINDIDSETEIDEIALRLVDTITKACDLISPKIKNPKKSNNWWTREINDKRKTVNRLRRTYQRTSDRTLREERKQKYYYEKRIYEKEIKNSKTRSWRELCHNSKTWGLPFKIVYSKLKHEKSVPNFIRSDGQYTKTPEESLQYAMECLFPLDDIENDDTTHKSIRDFVKESPQTADDMPFTASEVNDVINSLPSNKSPGWDQINNEIIKNVQKLEPNLFLNLFNKCLHFGYFPKIWKISVIKILLKSSEKPKQEIKSYRPISLLCVVAKVLEKLVINRINYHMYSNNLLSELQFGFTPQKSTEDAINHLLNLAKNQIKKHQYLLVILLDIKGAFDNCWWPQILRQLKEKNCPKNLYNLIKSYLSNRYALIKLGNLLIARKLDRGCPQGSALGPGLWNISYDELLSLKTPTNTSIAGCCDDTKALIFGQNLKQIELKANKLLEDIHKWGRKVKLEFNTTKSCAILFTKKRSITPPIIHMNGTQIKIEDHIKYLGVFIDNKLNFNKHIDYICEKAIKKTSIIPIIARNTWGLSYESLKVMYTSFIESPLLYCSSIWGKNLYKYQIKKLRRAQRLFAIKLIKSYRTISYEAAVTIAGIAPIELKIKENINISEIKHNNCIEVEGLLSEALERKVRPHQKSHPAMAPNIVFIENDIINDSNNNAINVFTDGSKDDSCVGSAFCVFRGGTELSSGQYRLGPFCSVFQSELIAIKKSIEYIANICNTNETISVIIKSDSQSAIQAIKQFNNSHPIVNEIKELIRSLSKNVIFNIQWVRGHTGIEGNERADTLAKEAANKDLSESIYNSFSLSYAKRHFKTVTVNEWQNIWRTTSNASQTKSFFPSISDRLALKTLRPNYVLTQFLSGHGNFGSYLKRFKLRDSDICDCGLAQETPLHVILECLLFAEERHQLINACHRSGHNIHLTPNKLMSDKNLFIEFQNFLNI